MNQIVHTYFSVSELLYFCNISTMASYVALIKRFANKICTILHPFSEASELCLAVADFVGRSWLSVRGNLLARYSSSLGRNV